MRPVTNLTVGRETPLAEVIGVIETGYAQIALVTDEAGVLIGTVTDGDVRRALLAGEGLTSPADRFMNRKFYSTERVNDEGFAAETMKKLLLDQLPLVDPEGILLGLYHLHDMINVSQPGVEVVIMAGGEGKRLRPLTEDCPKPMLSLGGKPILETIIRSLQEQGLIRISICVNYLKESIIDYFGDGHKFGVDIKYIHEDKPLGTAGGLSLISKPDYPLLVINGDVISRVDFLGLLNFHHESKSCCTICLREYHTRIPYGVIEMDESRVTGIIEKPGIAHFINAGIYMLEPDVLGLLDEGVHIDMTDLVSRMIQEEMPVHGFPIHEYWADIGHHEQYDEANNEFSVIFGHK